MIILISAVFRVAAVIRGRRFFQCGSPKVRRLQEGSAYLRPGVCLRKYDTRFCSLSNSSKKQLGAPAQI